MQRLTPIAAAFALALSGAAAADTQDNAALREEIRALQQRLEALEQTSASTQPTGLIQKLGASTSEKLENTQV